MSLVHPYQGTNEDFYMLKIEDNLPAYLVKRNRYVQFYGYEYYREPVVRLFQNSHCLGIA